MTDAITLIAAMRVQEPVAWLYTNVQSGDIEASTDPDWSGELAVYWSKQPLYTRDPAALDALQAEIERLTRELAEARADAERYRQLRDRAAYGPARRPVVWMTVSHEGNAPDTHETWLDGEELDAAIDAAKEQSNG